MDDMHYGKIRYISDNEWRINAFRTLVKERNLKTHDLTLILSTIGFNPDHYHHFKSPTELKEGVGIKPYVYNEDPFKELGDRRL